MTLSEPNTPISSAHQSLALVAEFIDAAEHRPIARKVSLHTNMMKRTHIRRALVALRPSYLELRVGGTSFAVGRCSAA